MFDDFDVSHSDLRETGKQETVIAAVEALTKLEGEDYEEFIGRVMQNELWVKIKIADIEDNINVLRLAELSKLICSGSRNTTRRGSG